MKKIILAALFVAATFGQSFAQQSPASVPLELWGQQIRPLTVADRIKLRGVVSICRYNSTCYSSCESCYAAGCGCSQCCNAFRP